MPKHLELLRWTRDQVPKLPRFLPHRGSFGQHWQVELRLNGLDLTVFADLYSKQFVKDETNWNYTIPVTACRPPAKIPPLSIGFNNCLLIRKLNLLRSHLESYELGIVIPAPRAEERVRCTCSEFWRNCILLPFGNDASKLLQDVAASRIRSNASCIFIIIPDWNLTKMKYF